MTAVIETGKHLKKITLAACQGIQKFTIGVIQLDAIGYSIPVGVGNLAIGALDIFFAVGQTVLIRVCQMPSGCKSQGLSGARGSSSCPGELTLISK